MTLGPGRGSKTLLGAAGEAVATGWEQQQAGGCAAGCSRGAARGRLIPLISLERVRWVRFDYPIGSVQRQRQQIEDSFFFRQALIG